MKFKISKDTFYGALSEASGYVGKVDIHKLVFVQSLGGKIIIRATDMVQDYCAYLEADIIEDGSFCIDVVNFLKALDRFDDIITFTVDSKIKARSGKISLSYQVSSSEEYPIFSKAVGDKVIIDSSYSGLFAYMDKYIGTTNPKPVVSCLWLKDGFIACASVTTGALCYFKEDVGIDLLIPKGFIKKVSDGLVSGCDILVSDSEITLKYENKFIRSKLISDVLPNFKAIIERVDGISVDIDRVEFLKAIDSVTSFDNILLLTFIDGKIVLQNDGCDNTLDSILDIDAGIEGNFRLDSSYLKLFLNFSSDDIVTLYLNENNLPIKIEDSKHGLILNEFRKE